MNLKQIIAAAAVTMTTTGVYAETHTVRIIYNNFSPHHLIINVGDEVEWIQESTLNHKVTTSNDVINTEGTHVARFARHDAHVPAGGTSFKSEILLNGSTFKHRFDEPGIYKYVCPIHPHKMFGYIEVVQN